MLQCNQGRNWQRQSILPAQSMTLIEEYEEVTALRFATSSNGVMLGSTDGGAVYTVTGPFPSSSNRTWVALATCPIAVGTNGYGVVAADSTGNIWGGSGTTALPVNWVLLRNVTSGSSPALSGTVLSLGCAGVANTAPFNIFTIIVSTSSQVLFGYAESTVATPMPGLLTWQDQSTRIAPAGTAFKSVSGAAVDQRTAAAQTALYAAAFTGGLSLATLVAPASLGTAPSLTWSSITGAVPGSSANFVSVDLASNLAAAAAASTAGIVIAVGGGGVYSSTAAAASWVTLNAGPNSWVKAKYSTLVSGEARVVALLANGTAFISSATPAAGVVLNRVTAATTGLVTAGNPLALTPICADVSVSTGGAGTTAKLDCVRVNPQAFGNSTYTGVATINVNPATWAVTSSSPAKTWSATAVGRNGTIAVALADIGSGDSEFWVSYTGGQSWKLVFTYTTATCTAVTCDAQCTKIVAICDTRMVFSVDSGASFQLGPVTFGAAQVGVALNPEGTRLYVCAATRNVEFSTDTTGFATFTTRSTYLPDNCNSIAAGGGLVVAFGTANGIPAGGIYLSRDGTLTSPVDTTLSPGVYNGVKVSESGNTLAGFLVASRTLVTRSCNASVCTAIPNDLAAFAGGTTAGTIAMTPDGGRIFAAGGAGTASAVFPGTLSTSGSYTFGAGTGPSLIWGGISASENAGVVLGATTTTDIFQAYG